MENNLNFGTFYIPKNKDEIATYTVPAIFPKEFMRCVVISTEDDTVKEEVTELEVTHGKFFGENINRVIDLLKK